MRRLLGVYVLCGLWISAIAPRKASADTSREPVYEIDVARDLGVALAAGALSLGFQFREHTPRAYCAPLCDASELNALDRSVAGHYDTRFRALSHVGVGLTYAVSLTLLLTHRDLEPAFVEALVVAESVLVATGLNVLATHAIDRPRPYLYGTEAPESARQSGDGHLSFPSGHTASVAASSTATTFTLFKRGERRKAWFSLATGTLLTGAVAVSRTVAGDHFPTDVLVGAVFGTGIGLLIPALHVPSGLHVQTSRQGVALSFARPF